VSGSLRDIAIIIVYGLSVFFVAALIVGARLLSVSCLPCLLVRDTLCLQPSPPFRGRIVFLLLYLLTLQLQLLTTGSLLQQGSKAVIILTSIHAGLVAAMFWGLLANALVATQVVEDGTFSGLIVRSLFFVWLMES
jgi:hypothetical protein